jgi:hypothetical protein
MNRPEGVDRKATGLRPLDHVLLYVTLVVWVVVFLLGILIDSSPYRAKLITIQGPASEYLVSGLVVALTYTLTNVAILCVLAGVLGTLGRRSQLGADRQGVVHRDTVNPRSSAVLRGFLVYLALISGVLILGDDPAQPTQKQYVRLAGFVSLFSFVVNFNPALFGGLLRRLGEQIDKRDESPGTQ